MSEMIRFSSSDGWELSAPKEVACQSLLIRSMLENIPRRPEQPIPIPNVSGFILEKIFEYANEHKDDPPYQLDDDLKPTSCDGISDWDKEFIDVDQGTLFEIVRAANYLDFGRLLELGCKTIARIIKGKSVEEMRRMFNIENDFTPEEEERIARESEWCEDK